MKTTSADGADAESPAALGVPENGAAAVGNAEAGTLEEF